MGSIPWIAVAFVAGLIFMALAARAGGWLRSPDGDPETGDTEKTPPTQLQRVAWWTLAAGGVCVVAVLALLLHHGVNAWWNDAHVRLPVTALMVGTLVVSAAPGIAASRAVAAGRAVVDERDLEILARAPRIQGVSVLVSLGLWTAALMEAFHAEGQVPVPFVVLVCWSCLLIYALALPAGILFGYRSR